MKLSPIVLDKMMEMHIAEDVHMYLIVTFLYHSGIINRQKLLALYKARREGTLERKVKTYHCKINNKWYDDTGTYTIYKDVYQEFRSQIQDIEFKDLITTMLLYNAKPKNYCIDWFFYNIIEPILDKYQSSGNYGFFDEYSNNNCIQMLKSFDIPFEKANSKTFDEWERTASTYGYCCEDCSGDFDEYMRNQYHSYVTSGNDKAFREDFSKGLNKLKSPDYLKNEKLMAQNYIL